MRSLPIHVRLTAWYMVSLTVIITLFAFASWYAMRASMYHAIDNDLVYRMDAVVPFIENHSLSTPASFARTFANSSDSSIVGVFVQITNVQSELLYQSDVLNLHKVAVLPPGSADGSLSRSTVQHEGWTIRVAARTVSVHGVLLTVHVVEPLSDLLASLHEITLRFLLLVSVALLGTACSGYWISRRALAPVELIRIEADAVDPTDLTARLHVPAHDDELGRLVRTLNSMLTRIEEGFHHVEQFTADASHELRAPLAFIITAGDICLRRERSREELTEGLSKIVLEARRMSKLVEDLLVLARGDALKQSPNLEPVELNALMDEAAERMMPAALAKDLELVTSLPDGPVCVCGVPSDLRRLLLILVDNAIKYTDHGRIVLGLAVEGEEVCMTVRDTGIGIDRAAIPHMFDRFWRADKVRSRSGGGVGLGLALAAQILHRHQGTISAKSTPGKGTVFTVMLQRSRMCGDLELEGTFSSKTEARVLTHPS